MFMIVQANFNQHEYNIHCINNNKGHFVLLIKQDSNNISLHSRTTSNSNRVTLFLIAVMNSRPATPAPPSRPDCELT